MNISGGEAAHCRKENIVLIEEDLAFRVAH